MLSLAQIRSVLASLLTGFNKRRGGIHFTILKVFLFLITLYYLVFFVLREEKFLVSWEALGVNLQKTAFWAYFAPAVALAFLNWGLEARKWQGLLRKLQPITFLRSFKAILAGSAVSLWAPNRVGEYLGRMLFVGEGKRLQSVFATLAGSMAQLTVTLVLGAGGLFYYLSQTLDSPWPLYGAGALCLLSSGMLLFFFFRLRLLPRLLPNWPLLRPLRRLSRIYSLYEESDLHEALLLSFLRYLVFCTQYLLLLWAFGGGFDLAPTLATLFLVFLVQTAVPTNAFTELGIRGAASVYFLSGTIGSEPAVLAASYLLWFINVLAPGLTGALLLLRERGK